MHNKQLKKYSLLQEGSPKISLWATILKMKFESILNYIIYPEGFNKLLKILLTRMFLNAMKNLSW